jgi:hypothetical protein
MNLLITGFGLPTDAVPEENPLKITVNLSYVLKSHLHLHCKDQSVNYVYGNNNNNCLL